MSEAPGVPRALLFFIGVEWWDAGAIGRGVAPGLPGWGRPAGAGIAQLDWRLGGAARRARYFLIWQLPPPHLPSPDRSDQPGQGHLLPSQQIRKRVAGLAALSDAGPRSTAFTLSEYPASSLGCPSPGRKESGELLGSHAAGSFRTVRGGQLTV